MTSPQQPPYQSNFGPTGAQPGFGPSAGPVGPGPTATHANFGPSSGQPGYPPQAATRTGTPNPALIGAWGFTVAALVSGGILALLNRNDLDQSGARFTFIIGVVLLLVGLVSMTISFAATAVVSQLKSGNQR